MRRHRLRGRPGERRRAIRATVGAAIVAVAALAGCGVGEPQPDTRQGVSSQGLEAFRAGIYAFAAPPTSCGQCHAVGHVPLFASPEIHAAYAAAKLLVDFAHPTGSLLITYSQNNHCGMDTMCGADSGNGEIVQRNLIEWADAELGAGSGGGLPAGPKFATAS